MKLEYVERPIHVAVRIREPLLHAGACAALQKEPGITVVDHGAHGPAAGPHVLVVDGSAVPPPDARTGVRLLVVAASARRHAIRAAFKEGIHGIVLSTASLEEFVCGIRTIAEGQTYLCRTLTSQMRDASCGDVLTRREDDVLQLLAQGLCNKSIGRQLDIAPGTVKFHVKSIMEKLNASTRTEVASIAISRGMTEHFALALPRHAV
jgi:DNA-binding NarL/FixJ family response regulator